MENLENLGRELLKGPKGNKIKNMANSDEVKC